MKLQAERMLETERLHREVAALGQQFSARRKFKSFAVPMVDMVRPVRADRGSCGSGADRVISDLHAALRMRSHPAAEMHREHLRAQANSQQRPLLPKRHCDPLDLAANIIIRIVGAHRAAENDRTGMLFQRLRQRVAEARTPDIEPVSKCPQHVADPARRRRLLVQHDQNRPQRRGDRGHPDREAQDIIGAGFDGLKRHRTFFFAVIKPQSWLSVP